MTDAIAGVFIFILGGGLGLLLAAQHYQRICAEQARVIDALLAHLEARGDADDVRQLWGDEG